MRGILGVDLVGHEFVLLERALERALEEGMWINWWDWQLDVRGGLEGLPVVISTGWDVREAELMASR